MDSLDDLRKTLALKEREIAIIGAIDRIRDQEAESEGMFAAIVKVLAESINANFCLLFLTDGGSGKLKLGYIYNPQGFLEPIESFFTEVLLDKVFVLNQTVVWDTAQQDNCFMKDWPIELHLAIVPIILGSDHRLGVLFLGKNEAFPFEELQILETAEDQVDSAIVQGYVNRRHQETVRDVAYQHRLLQMITEIDSIRDSSSEPNTLFSAIVNYMANSFDAGLSLLFIKDPEGGELELKMVSDRMERYGELHPVISHSLVEKSLETSQVKIWSKTAGAFSLGLDILPEGLQLAAIPIVMGGEQRLGVLLLARDGRPFSQEEISLWKMIEDHIDSTILQAEVTIRHQQTITEVEAIYQIDHLRDQNIGLDDLINRVIEFVSTRIQAEMGFIMLFDRSGEKLELRATSHQDLFHAWQNSDTFDQVVQQALDQGKLICKNDLGSPLHSVVCMPLILNEQIIGVLGAVNRLGRGGFAAADCRLLQAIASQIDTAIYERQEIRMLRQVLGRSVDPHVMERLLANPSMDVLRPERVELTVLFADIRGSTALAERTEPELLVEFIKDFLMQMTEVVFSFEGTVDKFVGDEVVALFGAPIPQQDHALRAVRVGLAMQERHRAIMEKWQGRGVQAPPIGIGIVTGRMIIGEMGGSTRSNYTVIGREVNLGSRICGFAEGGQVLISESTYAQVKGLVSAKALPAQRFKGVDHEVTIYEAARLQS